MKLQTLLGTKILCPILVVAALALAACGGYGGSGSGLGCAGYGGGGGGGNNNCHGNPAPSPSPSPAAQIVGVMLSNATATNDPTFGMVLGYFNGASGTSSQVVHLTANMTVQFVNFDSSLPHTASLLGAWNSSTKYPSTFTNSNGPTASAAGSIISSSNFSSGNINNGSSSAMFNSGGPGMFIFGCAYHYVSDGMRTVVVVM